MSRFNKEDPWFHRAKREGFAARSVYKLREIDKRHHLFRPGQKVLDLGCAPGSWLQYVARRVGPHGAVAGGDLSEVKITLPEWVTVIRADMYHLDLEQLRGVARRSFEIAGELLRPGGAWVAKVFQGEDYPPFRTEVRSAFRKLAESKPKSSRQRSVEIFLVGLGLIGKEADVSGE